MGKNVLVTGAAGFIGFHLSKKLLEMGYFVLGIDNLNSYYDVELKKERLKQLSAFPSFLFDELDLSDEQSLERLFDANEFDYVINLAAQAGVRYSITNPSAYIKSNIIGFYNLLEAVRKHPVQHLIYASSSSVYGHNEKVPYSVEDKTDSPVSLYAATKKSDELLAYSYSNLFGIKATGLRFFTVYGPWGRPDMAYFSFTKKILAGEPIVLFNNGDMWRDFTYVDDVVESIVKLLDCAPSPDGHGVRHAVMNIGNSHPTRLTDFVSTLEKILGRKAIIQYEPMQPGDVYQTFADVRPLESLTGFAPRTTLQEGLGEFWKWYKGYYLIND